MCKEIITFGNNEVEISPTHILLTQKPNFNI